MNDVEIMADLKRVYDAIAGRWYDTYKDEPRWWAEGLDAFIMRLSPDAKVLDVGCGAGLKAAYLLEKGVQVVGIDFSEAMITLARQEAPGGEFYVMDMQDVGQLHEIFDGLLLMAVLLHVPKKEVAATLQKLMEKLKPGGYTYMTVKERQPGKPEEELVQDEQYGSGHERFFSYYTEDELRGYNETAGLRVLNTSVVSVNDTRWIQLLGKK